MRLLSAGICLVVLPALAACGLAASNGHGASTSATADPRSAASASNSGDNGTPMQSQVACSVLPATTASAVLHQSASYANANIISYGGYPYESVCYYTVGSDPTGGSFYNLQVEVYCGPKEPDAWQAANGVTEAFPDSPVSGARIMSNGPNPDSASATAQAPGKMLLSVQDVGAGASGKLGADKIDTGIEPLLATLLSKVYASAVSQHACQQVMADTKK